MRIEECYKRIERYVKDVNKTGARFVNVNNTIDLKKFIEYFSTSSFEFINIKNYAKYDENASLDDFMNDLDKREGVVIVTGLTSYLKLLGEQELLRYISRFYDWSSNKLRLIILCYQCSDYLHSVNKKNMNTIYEIDGVHNDIPKIVFLPKDNYNAIYSPIVNGINNISDVLEEINDGKEVYIVTNKTKSCYEDALYQINEIENGFSALNKIDSSTAKFQENYGTSKQWNDIVEKLNNLGGWGNLFAEKFGKDVNLKLFINQWYKFTSEDKWLYFLALKYYEVKECEYFNLVINKANNVDEFVEIIYLGILDYDCNHPSYWNIYQQRRAILNDLKDTNIAAIKFCKNVDSKEENTIYYLTDKSEAERQLIYKNLSLYAVTWAREKIIDILNNVYPDLACYLQPYKFKQALLNQYFDTYKFAKVLNFIPKDFMELVNTQAEKREFLYLLPSRTEKTESIDVKNAEVYFIDAMGVEYLGYITQKCRENNLRAKITICHCEIPSITSLNKDFVEVFEKNGAIFCPDKNGIKELDQIKHHGKEDFDFTRNKLPTYLTAELSVLNDVIVKASNKLIAGQCKKVIIISDHGASRLCVINGQENQWEMKTKGEHSGRCCAVSEIDSIPDCATEESNYWVLANYDRFKGSRKANVEVHGGATLEEVVVPIIELTCSNQEVIVDIITSSITFIPRRRNAVIKLHSTEELDNLSVVVYGNGINLEYDAETNDDKNFVIKLQDLQKSGEYLVDVYSNGELISKALKFSAKNAAFSTNNLF